MSDPMHDRGEHYLTTPKAEPFLERLLFNNRALILVAFFVLTLFLGYNAIKIQPDASFERMIPLEHPYIVNMLDHRDDLDNLGNLSGLRLPWKKATSLLPNTWKPSSRSPMRCSI